jgi:flagellar biosynthesis/type III secretory pathway M-ring protein FliF/YscJ
MLLLALAITACGPSKKEEQLAQASDAQKKLIEQVSNETRAIAEAAKKAQSRSAEIRSKITALGDDVVRTNTDLEGIVARVSELEAKINETNKALAAQNEKAKRSGGSFWAILLIVLAIIVALFIIFRLTRSKSEFEEEDDDFADFEDDDDLGFDDEFGDDVDGKKKDEKKGDEKA